MMAICNLEGMWDGEMRIPSRSRVMLADFQGPHWKLDSRGYPLPSKAFMDEVQRLEDEERAKTDSV